MGGPKIRARRSARSSTGAVGAQGATRVGVRENLGGAEEGTELVTEESRARLFEAVAVGAAALRCSSAATDSDSERL